MLLEFLNFAIAPSGPWSPHYRYFTITLRHTTFGRTSLDKWSARSREVYLTTHNTQKRQACSQLYSKPQFQQTSEGRPTPYIGPPPRPLGSAVCTVQLLNFLVHKHWDSICTKFYILLAVHLVMILGKWPIWRTVFSMYLFQFSTCFEQPRANHQENQLYQYSLWYMSLCVGDSFVCRSESSQSLYWYNWFSWWWARGCSKHVENLNKYIEKSCASSWSFTKYFYWQTSAFERAWNS
jgi:hypothetical protein